MDTLSNLSKKSFAVYGLGSTGQSVVNYFNKAGFKNYITWDDKNYLKKNKKLYKKKGKDFLKLCNFVDYIIVSPGININKTKLKKTLLRNYSKIITDLDLFYMINQKVKSIVVTGTNGKSTTCKIIYHLLKKNKFNTVIGGNIGKPVLDLNLSRKPIVIIEASSFQLSYSKYIRPSYALILNITNDHLDWHGTMSNYINAKFKIFSLQNKNNFAFINDKRLKRKFKKNKYLAKLIFINFKKY